jgi:type II secretory pathway component PulF
MNNRIAHQLAWGAALLFSLYVLWGCYQVSRQVPAMAQLFAGLGSELPVSTRFVIWVSQHAIWPAGGLLVLLVVGKELRLRDAMIRLAITFLAFLAVTWFFSFAVSAMHEPLVGILRQIG